MPIFAATTADICVDLFIRPALGPNRFARSNTDQTLRRLPEQGSVRPEIVLISILNRGPISETLGHDLEAAARTSGIVLPANLTSITNFQRSPVINLTAYGSADGLAVFLNRIQSLNAQFIIHSRLALPRPPQLQQAPTLIELTHSSLSTAMENIAHFTSSGLIVLTSVPFSKYNFVAISRVDMQSLVTHHQIEAKPFVELQKNLTSDDDMFDFLEPIQAGQSHGLVQSQAGKDFVLIRLQDFSSFHQQRTRLIAESMRPQPVIQFVAPEHHTIIRDCAEACVPVVAPAAAPNTVSAPILAPDAISEPTPTVNVAPVSPVSPVFPPSRPAATLSGPARSVTRRPQVGQPSSAAMTLVTPPRQAEPRPPGTSARTIPQAAFKADPNNTLRLAIENYLAEIRHRQSQAFTFRRNPGFDQIPAPTPAELAALNYFDQTLHPELRAFDDSVALAREAAEILRNEYDQTAVDLIDLAVTDADKTSARINTLSPALLRLLGEALLGSESSVVVMISRPQNALLGEGFIPNLAKMYERYANRMKWTFELSDDEISDTSMTFRLSGHGVYAAMVMESGEHKRIDMERGRPETRRAEVKAFREPTAEELMAVEFSERDVEIEAFRRGMGAGGQNVNKVETSIRARHRPTGIVVVCNIHRTQDQNRSKALQMLRAQVFDHLREVNRERLERIRASSLTFQMLAQTRMVRTYDSRETTSDVYFSGQIEASATENLRAALLNLLPRATAHGPFRAAPILPTTRPGSSGK